MFKPLAALATLALALPASAAPQSPDYHNGGQCAGDRYSKCRYSLEIVAPPVDNGLMVDDPMFGPSRLETVVFCLNESGVDRYQDLITDDHFDIYEGCMIDQV